MDRVGPPSLAKIHASQYFSYNPNKKYISITSNEMIVGNSQVGKGFVFPNRNFEPNRTVGEWNLFVDLNTPFPESIIYFDVDKINGSYGTGYVIKYDGYVNDAILGVNMIYKSKSGEIKEIVSRYNCNVSFEDQRAVNNLIIDAIYVAKSEFAN